MNENTVLTRLEKISGSNLLRKKFLYAFRGPVQQDYVGKGDTPNSPVVTNHLSLTAKEVQLVASECLSGSDTLLEPNVLQSRVVSLGASMLQ